MKHFYSQQATWSAGDFDPQVEVATIEVPLSYADPGGDRIELAISRVRCGDPAKRRGILLTLNGGPAGNWGGGIKLPLRFAYTPLRQYYDIIGIDPRGTGASTPLWREDPRPTAPFNTRPSDDEFAAITDDVKRLYEGCASIGGPLREQITSANMARDIDVVRAVLGEEKLTYVGYGDPTYNGAVYATMFPSRVDRMVLDSSRNPDVGWRGQFHSQVTAVYENVDAWADWVSERNIRFGLGTTKAAVLAATEEAAFRTYTPAFDVGIGTGTRHRPLWAVTADLVAQLRNPTGEDEAGDAQAAVQKLASLDAWAPGEPQERVQSVTEAATCEDEWPTDLETYYADMRIARDKYPYGYGVLRFQPQVGTFWTDRKMEKPPEIKRDGFDPGVVVHGIGNTMLQHAGGEAMAKRLGFSLISVVDEGQNEIFAVRGNKEVDDYVYQYLIDGVLPSERVTCAGPSRPDVATDSAGGATGSGAGTLLTQIDEWAAANRSW
ncbi:MAG TPA: alpha/beta hydrolase [Micromonosporaceae bacterium]|nr:alpha/beta hydrolase [Micromonosporaceae bacterium]